MKKILSLSSKDFSTGIAPYKNDARFGLMFSANGYNPSLFGGDIAFTKAPVDISSTVVVDNIIQFTISTGSVVYAIGSSGHLYKIASLSTTPVVTDLKSVTPLTTPAAIFTFKTIVGNKDIVYYMNNSTRIGSLDPTDDSLNDTYITLATSSFSTRTPVFVAEDEVYFGTLNTISKLYDDGANAKPAQAEAILDFPKGEFVQALTSDDTYLIIANTLSTGVETKIYFWDYQNNYDSWVKPPYRIPDTIYSLETVNGITYGLGRRGLWQFTFSSYPTLIREDVSTSSADINQLGTLKDLLLITGTSGVVAGWGRVNNYFKTSLTKMISGITGTPITVNFTTLTTRGLISSPSKLYYVDYTTQKTASSDVITTSYVNLGDEFKIKKVSLVFADKLASGDSVAIRLRRTSGSTDGVDYQDMTTVSFTNNGAVNNALSETTNELEADFFSLELTISGTCVIKRIDVYGERINRTN
jgi:hypothetical protein